MSVPKFRTLPYVGAKYVTAQAFANTTLLFAAKVPATMIRTEKYTGGLLEFVFDVNIRVSAGETQPNGITVLLEGNVARGAVTISATVVCAFVIPSLDAVTVIV